MPTVRELRAQAKAKRVPKYSKLNKAGLLSALGMGDEAKAHKAKTTQRKAVAAHAASVGGDSAVKKAQAKGRILRTVQRSLKQAEVKKGQPLSQDEKRAVAAKAVQQEAQAIKSGKPEVKGRRGGNLRQSKPKNNIAPLKRDLEARAVQTGKGDHEIKPSPFGKRKRLEGQIKGQQTELRRVGEEANEAIKKQELKKLQAETESALREADAFMKEHNKNKAAKLDLLYQGKLDRRTARLAAAYKRSIEIGDRIIRVPKGTTQIEYNQILGRLIKQDKDAIDQYTIPKPKGYRTALERKIDKERRQSPAPQDMTLQDIKASEKMLKKSLGAVSGQSGESLNDTWDKIDREAKAKAERQMRGRKPRQSGGQAKPKQQRKKGKPKE